MKILRISLILLLGFICLTEAYFTNPQATNKVVCYYNSRGHSRQGKAKFEIFHLDVALQVCTHLVYGYAAIDPETYKMVPLNNTLDTLGNHYRDITNLKRRFPGLTVLLSVGGGEDLQNPGGKPKDKNIKYRTLLESSEHRQAFVNSAHNLLINYGFDGLDLAWEFPETKPKVKRGKVSSFFHGIKSYFVSEDVVDEKADEHREQFTALTRELRNKFKFDGFMLSLSVLPNVNSSVYYSPQDLSLHLDLVNLMAFDFYTPLRNPEEADFPAPLYQPPDRRPDENLEFQVRYWLDNSFPRNKIVIGIPTFGRSWKMDSDSEIAAVPPVTVDGPGDPGIYTNEPGLLSQVEICTALQNAKHAREMNDRYLRRVGDPLKINGVYAFRIPDDDGNDGIWIAYEDNDCAGEKAMYAKAKSLGGISIVDLTLDDFGGFCEEVEYPILRAARFRMY